MKEEGDKREEEEEEEGGEVFPSLFPTVSIPELSEEKRKGGRGDVGRGITMAPCQSSGVKIPRAANLRR